MADYTVLAVDRALSVLDLVAEYPALGVSEIAARSDQTRSLAFRLLRTLEQRGYVIKDEKTRTYTLGYRALSLASKAQLQFPLLRVARPHLVALAAKTRQNIHLTARDGTTSVTLFAEPSPSGRMMYAQMGRRGPLHVGGGPKVLLAYAPAEIRNEVLSKPLERFTDKTVTDPAELNRTLDEIRVSGINENHGDLDRNSFSIAAPIRDAGGAVVAALSIAGAADQLTDALVREYRSLVLEYAEHISSSLGWQSRMAIVV